MVREEDCVSGGKDVKIFGDVRLFRGDSIADATDAGSAITQLNLVISRLVAVGLLDQAA